MCKNLTQTHRQMYIYFYLACWTYSLIRCIDTQRSCYIHYILLSTVDADSKVMPRYMSDVQITPSARAVSNTKDKLQAM